MICETFDMRHLSFLFFLAISLSAFAQSGNHSRLQPVVGSQVGIFSEKGEGFCFMATPDVVFPLSDHFDAGLAVPLRWYAVKESGMAWGVSPYLRFHADFLDNRLGLLATGGLEMTRTAYDSGKAPLYSLDVGFRPGFYTAILKDKLYLQFQIGFIGYHSERWGDERTKGFRFRLDRPDVRVGLYVRIPPRRMEVKWDQRQNQVVQRTL